MPGGSQEAVSRSVPNVSGKYLTVRLGNEEYGLKVLKVREIIRNRPATAVPHTPIYVTGVINLRGKVIPVVDLRIKFGLPAGESNARCCIVVLDTQISATQVLTGIIVDEVLEVASIDASELEATPEFEDRVARPEVLALAKTESGVRILLDTDRVLAIEELASAPVLQETRGAHGR